MSFKNLFFLLTALICAKFCTGEVTAEAALNAVTQEVKHLIESANECFVKFGKQDISQKVDTAGIKDITNLQDAALKTLGKLFQEDEECKKLYHVFMGTKNSQVKAKGRRLYEEDIEPPFELDNFVKFLYDAFSQYVYEKKITLTPNSRYQDVEPYGRRRRHRNHHYGDYI